MSTHSPLQADLAQSDTDEGQATVGSERMFVMCSGTLRQNNNKKHLLMLLF